jgi:hypothetical protein
MKLTAACFHVLLDFLCLHLHVRAPCALSSLFLTDVILCTLTPWSVGLYEKLIVSPLLRIISRLLRKPKFYFHENQSLSLP